MILTKKALQTHLDTPGLPYNTLPFIYGALSGCAVLPEYLQEGVLLCLLYKFSPETSAAFVEKSEELHSTVDFAQDCIEEIEATLERGKYPAFFATQETVTDTSSLREWCKGFLTAVHTWVDQRNAVNLVPKPANNSLGLLTYFSDPAAFKTPGIIEFEKAGKLDHPGKMIPELVRDIHNGLTPLTNYFDSLEFGNDPIENTELKTGRNDPCTCGSGKKFKKCCGGVRSMMKG